MAVKKAPARTDTLHLKRVRNTWYVRLRVPADLVERFGAAFFVRSLKTGDLAIAKDRRWEVVREIKAQFARLRGHGSYMEEAAEIGNAVAAARLRGDADQVDAGSEAAEWHAEKTFRRTRDRDLERRVYTRATADTPTIAELLERWLPASSGSTQTQSQHRLAVESMAAALGVDYPKEVTLQLAARHVSEAFRGTAQAYATSRRKLNSLVAFWRWMTDQVMVLPREGGNPWTGFRLSTGKRGRASPTDKRPYTVAELVQLLGGTPPALAIADLAVLALYTGGRLDELCSLRVKDVAVDSAGAVATLAINESKTDAGVRRIPVVHPTALGILKRRVGDRSGGEQLFIELQPGGYDESLSWAISKSFGRYKTKRGLPRATDFHSFRRNVSTLLENASLDPTATMRFFGHKPPDMMRALYSGGASAARLLEVARAIHYPAEIEAAASEFLARAVQTRRAPEVERRAALRRRGARASTG